MSNLLRLARLSSVKVALLVIFASLFGGCGSDLHWFPTYERQPTDPDPFTFATKTNQKPAAEVTSDSITVSGLADATTKSPIKISPSNSKYTINNGTATSNEGTVVNGDKVTVTQTTSPTFGQSVTSTLTIGNVSGTFTATTQAFDITFGAPTTIGASTQVVGTFKSSITASHTISITDSTNSTNATYSTDGGVTFTRLTTTVTLSNNNQIYVRNLTSNVASGKTTLTVDDTKFEVL